jgi:hypothetical protein
MRESVYVCVCVCVCVCVYACDLHNRQRHCNYCRTQPIPSGTGKKHVRTKQKQKIHQTHCVLFVTAGDPPPLVEKKQFHLPHAYNRTKQKVSWGQKYGNVHIGESERVRENVCEYNYTHA